MDTRVSKTEAGRRTGQSMMNPAIIQPIAGDLLLEKELQSREEVRERSSIFRTGCREIDDHVLINGLQPGNVVGISAEDEGFGLLLGLQTIANSLLEAHHLSYEPSGKHRIVIATTLATNALLPTLRNVFRSQVSGCFPGHKKVGPLIKELLEQIEISRVFDMEGLADVLREIDTPQSLSPLPSSPPPLSPPQPTPSARPEEPRGEDAVASSESIAGMPKPTPTQSPICSKVSQKNGSIAVSPVVPKPSPLPPLRPPPKPSPLPLVHSTPKIPPKKVMKYVIPDSEDESDFPPLPSLSLVTRIPPLATVDSPSSSSLSSTLSHSPDPPEGYQMPPSVRVRTQRTTTHPDPVEVEEPLAMPVIPEGPKTPEQQTCTQLSNQPPPQPQMQPQQQSATPTRFQHTITLPSFPSTPLPTQPRGIPLNPPPWSPLTPQLPSQPSFAPSHPPDRQRHQSPPPPAPLPQHPSPLQDPQPPPPAPTPGPPQLPSFLLITHTSTLLTSHFAHIPDRPTAHARLGHLSNTLRNLARRGILVVMLNGSSMATSTGSSASGSAISGGATVGTTANPAPKTPLPSTTLQTPQQSRHHDTDTPDGRFNPTTTRDGTNNTNNDNNSAAALLSSIFTSISPGGITRRKRPAYGGVFDRLLDLHLLCTRVSRESTSSRPVCEGFGTRGYSGDGGSWGRGGNNGSVAPGSGTAGSVWVLEVVGDIRGVIVGNTDIWAGPDGEGQDTAPVVGKTLSRDRRWGIVDVAGGGNLVVDAVGHGVGF